MPANDLKYPTYPPAPAPEPETAIHPEQPSESAPISPPSPPSLQKPETPQPPTQPKSPDWFSQVTPAPPFASAPAMPKTPRFPPLFLYLFIIAATAVLTGAIYLISQNKLSTVIPKTSSPANTPTSLITPTTPFYPTATPTTVPAEAVDTSNWQTFSNPDYNYQVKHPSDWTVSQWKMDKEPVTKIQNIVEIRGLNGELLQVNTWLNPNKLPLFTFLEQVYQKADTTRAKIVYPAEANLTVTNQSARFVSLGGNTPSLAIILSVNDKIYEIYEVNAPDPANPLTGTYGAILKSFEVR